MIIPIPQVESLLRGPSTLAGSIFKQAKNGGDVQIQKIASIKTHIGSRLTESGKSLLRRYSSSSMSSTSSSATMTGAQRKDSTESTQSNDNNQATVVLPVDDVNDEVLAPPSPRPAVPPRPRYAVRTIFRRAPTEQVLVLIRVADHLQRYAAENTPSKINFRSRFTERHLVRSPDRMSFLAFVEKVADYANLCLRDYIPDRFSTGVRCSVMAVAYLERFRPKINPLTVHRYFLTAFMLAYKYSEDLEVPNAFWARLCGIPFKELNHMEASFCKTIKWNFRLHHETYAKLLEAFLHVAVDNDDDDYAHQSDLHHQRIHQQCANTTSLAVH